MRGAPVPPEEYVEEGEEPLTDGVLRRDGWAVGLGVWDQMGKAYEWYLNGGGGRSSEVTGLDNAQMWSLQEAIKAHARRSDPVAEWLKRERDKYPNTTIMWGTMDNLIDAYHEHADTGTPLTENVQGPHEEGS